MKRIGLWLLAVLLAVTPALAAADTQTSALTGEWKVISWYIGKTDMLTPVQKADGEVLLRISETEITTTILIGGAVSDQEKESYTVSGNSLIYNGGTVFFNINGDLLGLSSGETSMLLTRVSANVDGDWVLTDATGAYTAWTDQTAGQNEFFLSLHGGRAAARQVIRGQEQTETSSYSVSGGTLTLGENARSFVLSGDTLTLTDENGTMVFTRAAAKAEPANTPTQKPAAENPLLGEWKLARTEGNDPGAVQQLIGKGGTMELVFAETQATIRLIAADGTSNQITGSYTWKNGVLTLDGESQPMTMSGDELHMTYLGSVLVFTRKAR